MAKFKFMRTDKFFSLGNILHLVISIVLAYLFGFYISMAMVQTFIYLLTV